MERGFNRDFKHKALSCKMLETKREMWLIEVVKYYVLQ